MKRQKVTGGANIIHLGGDHSNPEDPNEPIDEDHTWMDTIEKWTWNGSGFDIVASKTTVPWTQQNYYEGMLKIEFPAI